MGICTERSAVWRHNILYQRTKETTQIRNVINKKRNERAAGVKNVTEGNSPHPLICFALGSSATVLLE